MHVELTADDRNSLIARYGLQADVTDEELQEYVLMRVTASDRDFQVLLMAEADSRNKARRANDPVLRRATQNARRRYDRSSPAQPVDAEGEQLISAAVVAGKFPASRTDHYRRRFARDPQGTAELIGRMAPVELGNPELWADVGQDDAYPVEWLRSSDGDQRRSRVTSGD